MKQFGSLIAVDNVSFSVNQGEIFGLLGPNGAGKTTIINMLITLLCPDSGFASINGYSICSDMDYIRRQIGVIFQDPSLDVNLTARENLDFHGMMYGMSFSDRKTRISEILEILELSDRADDMVENFSGGMKRRLEIGRGLMHSPKVLFLDEPTLGLDAQTRRRIWDYIRKLNQQFLITVIITTHYLEEADFLCDRVAIIDHGSIVALDTPDNLKNVIGGDILILECGEYLHHVLTLLNGTFEIIDMKTDESRLILTLDSAEKKIPQIISFLQENRIGVFSVSLKKPSLEEVFLYYTGRSIREEKGSMSSHMHAMMARRMRQ